MSKRVRWGKVKWKIIILIIKINTNVFKSFQAHLSIFIHNNPTATLHVCPRHSFHSPAQPYEPLYCNQLSHRHFSRNWSHVQVFLIQVLKFLVRMSSSEESSGAQVASNKSTVSTEFLILLCLNKVSQDLPLELPSLGILPLLKYSLLIIFSLLLIRLSMKPLNTDTDQEDNSNAENWHSDQHGAQLATAPCITLNLLKPTSVTLQASKWSFPETQSRPRDCFWLQLETPIQSYFFNPKRCIETRRPMFQMEILNWPCKKLKSSMKAQT